MANTSPPACLHAFTGKQTFAWRWQRSVLLHASTRAASNPRCRPAHAFQVATCAALHCVLAVCCNTLALKGLLGISNKTLASARQAAMSVTHCINNTTKSGSRRASEESACCRGININKLRQYLQPPGFRVWGLEQHTSQRSIHASKVHKAKHPVCAQNPAANRRARHG